MKIDEAIELLKTEKARAEKKSEIKILQNMIGILLDLQTRQLSAEDLAAVESELDVMELDAYQENRKRHLRRKLAKFQQFLKDKFSLIAKGHYTALGIAFGVAFGGMFGMMIDKTLGSSLGISFGIAFGLVVGRYLDAQAEAQNRVLNVESK
ncbi:hypothetical protein [uncultured Imperialibacter sp.]|uniref:hypothetical protein n=1 Tax=uncultured Imperialibacter sp. TaxID=1672639 RepID=UPI0030DABF35|tara:strand:+ start:1235 stop:1690 length:456 start_codon:yes stop_codon:yes gene_type:complete